MRVRFLFNLAGRSVRLFAAPVIAGLGLALMSTTASATVTYYTSRAAWEAAGATTNLATFDGLALGSHGNVLVQSGIKFDITRAAFPTDLVLIPGGSPLTNPHPSSEALSAPTTQYVTISLDNYAPFYAFGADFIANDETKRGSVSLIPTLSVSGPANYIFDTTVPVAPNTEGFFGFRSDLPVTEVDFRAVNFTGEATAIDNVGIDSFAHNPPSAAPEPASWALMMLAVGGMGAALRTRRRTVAT